MDRLQGDLRQALRSLRLSPAFALSCILMLAVGIGASTALFSVVEGVLLRPLPYPRPERLVQLSQRAADGHLMRFSDPNFEDVQAQSRGFAALAQVSGGASVAVTGTDEPTFATLALASRDFFRAFAVQPAQGRAFDADEQREGGPPVVVVSHAFWTRHLGSQPLPLSRTLTFEGRAYTVVGVMPEAFDYPVGTQLWVPRELEPRLPSRSAHNWRVVGRLADGVRLETAQVELTGIARGLLAQYGQDTRMHDIAVVPLHESIVGSARPTLCVLLGAAAFLLLVAGANVTNLLLARAATRERELAIHVALGAGPGALVRRFLTESLLLSLTGGALGALLASWSVQALLAAEPGNLPRVGEVQVNATALLFALGLSLLLALGLGLVTTLRAARQGPWATLVQGARTQSGGGGAERTRRALVVGQLALALMLLVGAALLARSLARLLSLDPGYRTGNVAVVSLVLPSAEDEAGRLRNVRMQEDLISRLSEVPGVRAVGAVSGFPLEGGPTGDGTFLVLNRPDEVKSFEDFERLVHEPERTGSAEYRVASEGYFLALGIPLVRGRLFDARDTHEAPHVAVISESLARARWPGEDPLGKLIQFGNMDGDLRPFTVVGVVADVRDAGLDEEPKPTLYGCSRQRLRASERFHLAVHGPADSTALATAARPVLRELAPELPVRLRTVESLLAGSLAQRRFSLLLLGAFGAVALLLSVAGLAAVVSYAVAQRTKEFGIRFALGATAGDVLGLVLRQAALLAGVGVALGVLGAVGLSRVLAGLVYGVSTTDPLVLGAVALLLLGVALLASWLPARRAARVDPMTVLRAEP
ncbi:ABC transporter permease [Pyxidicoccus parkwayensis]|uniref:ABC transporter permease n=1 Tax=Pyxidicoccus parkwayensis TaxID=2813578 RepID=A0ABX7P5L4_9BACT|nr:ABC transporter permease [Pyxidicoccus parkwaysis]QSQ25774.1 ABC transporter permease [Pyxidicoccus parkwaysis]